MTGGPPAGRGRRPPRRGSGRAPARAAGPQPPISGTWLFGRRSVSEAVAARRALRILVAAGAHGLGGIRDAAADAGVAVEEVPRARLDQLAEGGLLHQGVAAWARPVAGVDLDRLLEQARGGAEAPLLVVAAHIQDPRNLGAIARTAEAAGAHGLVIPRHRAAPLTAAAERAAAGALAHLPVAVVDSLAAALQRCRDAGLWLLAADPAAPRLYSEVDLTVPVALVVGAEGAGVPPLVRRRCDLSVRLPMRGRVASLNAAVATGVLLYESVRQRTARSARPSQGSPPMG